MGFSRDGIDALQLRLKRLSKTPDVADQEMRKIAFEVRNAAVQMAPVDYSNLRKSIKIRRTAGVSGGVKGFIKGLSNYTIYIDMTTPATGRKESTVGEYAWMVHEHMGYGNVQGAIMPSEKSILSGNGTDPVGGKFIDRATQKYKFNSKIRIEKVVRDFIGSLD